MSNLPSTRLVHSSLAKPTLAAVIEEDSLTPKSPFSDSVSRTSSNKDESIIFATSQENRKSWLEETSIETSQRHKEKTVQLLLDIVRQLSLLRHSIQAARGKRLRSEILQRYECWIALWNIQEKQLIDVVQLLRKVFLWNSVVLEGGVVYVLFMVFKGYLHSLAVVRPKLGSATISIFCWLVLHWILSHRSHWLYPWESIILQLGRKYWMNDKE
ncbi:hypothetical protein GpartN1_g1168.t1 [Galdieria partita]|uniref:Uncharacterized protein n=1 Tax=Galdieria partita TaxID=83374 RepID=A0A9C7PSY7_9RHOD|nr:hypothetical protein GpartN1_g1168.t1 [Galdieria partita]